MFGRFLNLCKNPKIFHMFEPVLVSSSFYKRTSFVGFDTSIVFGGSLRVDLSSVPWTSKPCVFFRSWHILFRFEFKNPLVSGPGFFLSNFCCSSTGWIFLCAENLNLCCNLAKLHTKKFKCSGLVPCTHSTIPNARDCMCAGLCNKLKLRFVFVQSSTINKK